MKSCSTRGRAETGKHAGPLIKTVKLSIKVFFPLHNHLSRIIQILWRVLSKKDGILEFISNELLALKVVLFFQPLKLTQAHELFSPILKVKAK